MTDGRKTEGVVVSPEVRDHFFDPERADNSPRSAALFLDQASHLDDKFSDTLSRCREAVLRTTELHHLTHYTKGFYDFTVDVLAYSATHFDRSTDPIETRRNDYKRVGRQLSATATDLDEKLQEVGTGALIRTLLHTSRGMICCYPIIAKEHIVGLTFDALALPKPGVPLSKLAGAIAVDRAMAHLATDLRRQFKLQPQNPGAWITTPKPVHDETTGRRTGSSTAQPNFPYIEGTEDGKTALLLAAAHPDDLHYVAHCRDGEVTYSVDQLDHSQLGLFFTQITIEERRNFYRDLCRQFPVIIGQLGRTVGSTLGGRLDRVVLDVEQGAIYYYRVAAGEYLVGVTIDQDQVNKTDDKMGQLALDYRGR